MAKKQVPKLVDLALCSIEEFVTTMTKLICVTSKINNKLIYSMLEFMKHLSNPCIPQHLHDKMSIAVLTAFRNVFTEILWTRACRFVYNDFTLTIADQFLPEMIVVPRLMEGFVGAHLKAIKFSAWPLNMQDVFYNKLYDMVGLEILDLGEELKIGIRLDIEKTIVTGVSAMPNLVCFILHDKCTDNIILALAQNCKKLQKLDVFKSRSVTERSIGPLLSCKHLRRINLHLTSMTTPGYANLILEHLKIEDIGRWDKFGYVLEHIHYKNIGIKSSVHIKTLETRFIRQKQLYLLVDICPYITSLCLGCLGYIFDLTMLATLDYLKELKLIYFDFYTYGINTLLRIKGCAIMSLHLEIVREIDLNALILISQYCPDIRNLVFDKCEFLEHVSLDPRKLAVRPFQFLERIKCIGDFENMHLKFLLSHCINIKFIQLGESTEFGDDAMRGILLQNPMSKLEELKIHSSRLSMEIVQLLMQNCDNLRHLSDLGRWGGISYTELNIFKKHLKTTNANLDIRASLSFTQEMIRQIILKLYVRSLCPSCFDVMEKD